MKRYVIKAAEGFYNFNAEWVQQASAATKFSESEKVLFGSLPGTDPFWIRYGDKMSDKGDKFNMKEYARQIASQIQKGEIGPEVQHTLQLFFNQIAASLEDNDDRGKEFRASYIEHGDGKITAAVKAQGRKIPIIEITIKTTEDYKL